MTIPASELSTILGKLYTELEEHTNITRENSRVAGGCIRDYLNHKPIKDIDLYTTYPLSPATEMLLRQIPHLKFIKWLGKTYSGEENDLANVASCEFMGYPVEILFITTDSVEEYIDKHFDINICKVYFNPQVDKVIKTLAYEDGITTKTIKTTLEQPEDDVDAVSDLRALLFAIDPDSEQKEGHLDRVREKYPDFKVEYAT